MSGTLYGLGVGPGDPDLITVKALKILQSVPVVAYPAPETGDSVARGIVAPHLNGHQHEIPIRMPMPGQMTEECTVLQWFKAEGDTIAKGDPLFEIETDKSNMEIEAFDEGTLLRVDAPEGATVPVESTVPEFRSSTTRSTSSPIVVRQ